MEQREYRISNKEYRISKERGKTHKKSRTPPLRLFTSEFDIPCSTFDILFASRPPNSHLLPRLQVLGAQTQNVAPAQRPIGRIVFDAAQVARIGVGRCHGRPLDPK